MCSGNPLCARPEGCWKLLQAIDRPMGWPDSMAAQMVDAFFWYTGLVFWISVLAGVACIAAAAANDHTVRRRRLGLQ
jgi:hypothetical protein